MAQARVFNPSRQPEKNPCSTCGVGVPPTPSGFATSHDRRKRAWPQVAPIPNPGPEDEAGERSRVSATQARESQSHGQLVFMESAVASPRPLSFPEPQRWSPARPWHPYAPSMPPTRKAARLAARRHDAVGGGHDSRDQNPGWAWGAATALLASTAVGGALYYEHRRRCNERAEHLDKPLAHGESGGWHRYIFDHGCGADCPYEVLVTEGELQYGADGLPINAYWERKYLKTPEEAREALKLEGFVNKPRENPHESAKVLVPGFRVSANPPPRKMW